MDKDKIQAANEALLEDFRMSVEGAAAHHMSLLAFYPSFDGDVDAAIDTLRRYVRHVERILA